LGYRHTHGMVDPTEPLGGHATGYNVFDDRVYRPQDLDLEAAAWLPGGAFAPLHAAVDVSEAAPAMHIRENLPGKVRAGLGHNGMLKSKH
jgi:hypothetical protein